MQKVGLQQSLTQTTKLTPTQIQVIRMIELPSIELCQRINEELQENPALEEGRDEEYTAQSETLDEFDDNYMPDDGFDDGRQRDPLQNDEFNYEQYVSDDETPSYTLPPQYSGADEDRREVPIIGGSSLIEDLKSQIYLTKMTKPQRHVAKWVLGNIDDDGYLRRTIEQLVDDLMFQEQIQVTDEEMKEIVDQIKKFDPPGIASANLQECLLRQLEIKIEEEPTESRELAYKILSDFFDAFSKHHFDRIIQRLELDEKDFQAAVQEILKLNQKPANAFTGNVYEMRPRGKQSFPTLPSRSVTRSYTSCSTPATYPNCMSAATIPPCWRNIARYRRPKNHARQLLSSNSDSVPHRVLSMLSSSATRRS